MYKLNGARQKKQLSKVTVYSYWILYMMVGIWIQFVRIAARRIIWMLRKRSSIAAVMIAPLALAGSLLRGSAEEKKRRIRFFLKSRVYGPQAALYLKSGWLADKSPEPKGYGQVRRSIRERDDYSCQVCGVRGERNEAVRLHVDHIVPRRWGGSHSPENLRTLCKNCHEARHANLMDI